MLKIETLPVVCGRCGKFSSRRIPDRTEEEEGVLLGASTLLPQELIEEALQVPFPTPRVLLYQGGSGIEAWSRLEICEI